MEVVRAIPAIILAAYITALLLLIIIYGVRYYLYQREE